MDELTVAIAAAVARTKIQQAKLTFDWNPFTTDDDGFSFSVTYTNPNPPPALKTDTVTGTYHKSGGSVTFKAKGSTSTLIPNGVVYTIECKDKKLILKRKNFPDLAFDITR